MVFLPSDSCYDKNIRVILEVAMKTDRVSLSKFLSYLLRHHPHRYQLSLDEYGCVALRDVLEVVKSQFPFFREKQLVSLVKNDPKGRFEIVGDKIRATYGHSIRVSYRPDSVIPPSDLYHGTSSARAEKISREGLQPRGRQCVHLSVDTKDAYMVGLRHSRAPVVLRIDARRAYEEGVEFFREGYVFLTDYIPPAYIHKF